MIGYWQHTFIRLSNAVHWQSDLYYYNKSA